jgi:hypothetical protein
MKEGEGIDSFAFLFGNKDIIKIPLFIVYKEISGGILFF